MPEAGGKLEKKTAEFVCLNQRQDALFELIDGVERPFAFLVSKLLPGLHCKFKIRGRALHPTFRCFRGARPVEGRVDFHSIEESRIEFQLVGPGEWIKNASPRAWSGAWWITPAAGSDTPEAGVIR